MKPRKIDSRVLPALLLLSAATALNAGEAHVHGQARLEIAIEGELLTVHLESPLDNLLGFERAPRSERERQSVRRLAEQLGDSAALLRPSAAAQCTALDVRLDSPVLGWPAPAAHANEAEQGSGHGDLDATWHFRCARPEALRELTVDLFTAFRGLRRIDAVALFAGGQAAARLSAGSPRMRW